MLQLLIILMLLSVSTLVVIKCAPNSLVLQQEQQKEADPASDDGTLSDVPKTETLIAFLNSTQPQKAISFNNV